jgi:hypothetical protein
MPKFNLSRWLFLEQVINPTKDPGRFKAPEYGCSFFAFEGVSMFVMFHVGKLEEAVNTGKFEQGVWEEYLCSFAKAGKLGLFPENGNCSGAFDIEHVAANPKFPGAGYVCYAATSSLLKKPITSDRKNSSSEAAKKSWARIEQSPEWKKVPLDSFTGSHPSGGANNLNSWVKISGNWPNRKVQMTDKPRTKTENDDCKVPGFGTKGVNYYLGTADAWLYIGSSIDAVSLKSNGEEALRRIFNGKEQEGKMTMAQHAKKLFDAVYL